jgi:RHS repeat-associated protein
MRWDSTSGSYDMGFRNYDPSLNQFASRDMYDGATANMGLTTDPFTGSAYAFGDGNPISNVELDGHMPVPVPDGGSSNVPPELAALQALQTAYQEKNANAVSGDHTPAHDLVVIDAAIKILETAKSENASGTLTLDLEGGDAWKIDSNGDVTETQVPGSHNRIPGGSAKGNGKTGEADIMLTQNAGKPDQKVWIWEVKAAGKEDEAPEQLKRYIDKTQGGTVGWRLPDSPAIPDGKGGFIRAWSEENSQETLNVGDGIRLYADSDRNKENSNNNSQGQSAGQQQQALNQTCGIGILGLGNCPHAPGGITGDILGFLFGFPGPGTSGPSAPSPIEDPVPVGV